MAMLKNAQADGHKTTAHVLGIAASMASVIACACDRLVMDETSMMVVHLPWTATVGNANDLAKDIDVLDKLTSALISVYKTKFDLPEERIRQLLEDETWISGENVRLYNLDAEIIPTDRPLKIAACLKMPTFKHMPKTIEDSLMEKKTEPEIKAEVEAKKVETEPEIETEDEAMITRAECERRVSGMQSVMAKQMDTLKREYEARITDFEMRLETKEKELTQAQAEVTRLSDSLDDAANELLETSSLLAEKTNALDSLNAKVNTPAEVAKEKAWKNLHGDELLAYCRAHATRRN